MHDNIFPGRDWKRSICDWDNRPSQDKMTQMTDLSGHCVDQVPDYIYEHYNGFKLSVCSSRGTIYEDFIHDLVEEEVSSAFRCADVLREMGILSDTGPDYGSFQVGAYCSAQHFYHLFSHSSLMAATY